jgi:glycosyltransferase involved in cell wall biosynthesis
MRILLVNEARAGGGGVETYLSSIAGELASRGHDVALLFGNTAAEKGPTEIRTSASWSVADEGVDATLDDVRRWAPDVCFSHNMRWLDVDAAIARTWPTVKMMHGYFGTCVSGQKAFLYPAAETCTRTCGPACLALYGPRRCGQLRPLAVLQNYRWAMRQRSLFAAYRSFVVASNHMRAEYTRHGIAPDRIHAIPLFARADRDGSHKVEKSIDVLFLGRITRLKGADLLPDALTAASGLLDRRVTVTIAGEGPHRVLLHRAFAGRHDVDARFPGWVPTHEVGTLFRRARLVVMPSIWPEPFGLVGIEAAAHSVPAVAFDVGGIREWLTDDVNGALVDPAEGATGIGRAIAMILGDRAALERLSQGACASASRYSAGAHLDRLEAVLGSACPR